MNLSMMTFGRAVRTERQWRELLIGLGLNIARMEGPGPGSLIHNDIVEAVYMYLGLCGKMDLQPKVL